jgi:methionyl aminopeptidase
MGVRDRRVTLKSGAQIERMAAAGRLVAEVLDAVGEAIAPGVTTGDLDALATELIRDAGATPSFVGVPGHLAPYRHATCISIDDEVVHGIPGKRRIAEGQIVSVDAGAIVEGWHGDSARSWVVGEAPEAVRQLVEATRTAMLAGIAAAVPGNTLGDIGAAVEDVALAHGYGVVRSFVGHGIGTEMHEEPQVPNYRTGNRGRKIEVGLCLAIEPMFTLGRHEAFLAPDDWTIVTRDGSLAAHFEHTIAVTEHGPRILTLSDASPAEERSIGALGVA